MVTARNQGRGLPVVQLNAFGMLYGAVLVGLHALSMGQPFVFDTSARYLISLFYLTLFGSVFAFGAYLTLLVSTLFEGLPWRSHMLLGAGLCVAGNVLLLHGREKQLPTRQE